MKIPYGINWLEVSIILTVVLIVLVACSDPKGDYIEKCENSVKDGETLVIDCEEMWEQHRRGKPTGS